MNDPQIREKWKPEQIKYIQYLARGKKNKQGQRRSKAQFARAIGVHPSTIYEWHYIPGFKYMLLEAIVAENSSDLPDIIAVHSAKAKGADVYYVDSNGKRKKLNPDTGSLRELLKLYGLTAERHEVNNTGEVTHKWEEMADDELDRAIKARQDRAA